MLTLPFHLILLLGNPILKSPLCVFFLKQGWRAMRVILVGGFRRETSNYSIDIFGKICYIIITK